MKNSFKAIITLSVFLMAVSTSAEIKVLIVLTSHSELGDTGKNTGAWLPELTHPYYELQKAGFSVDIASVDGGTAPIDKKSFDEKDEYLARFLNDVELMRKVIRTIPLKEVNPKNYEAVLFSGGSGPMWDFPDNLDIQRIALSIYKHGGIVSALCHGNAALVNIKTTSGAYLIKGKKIAAFTNLEEKMLGTDKIVPFLLQDKLSDRGANVILGKAWQANAIVDGRLITGQNPASALKVAGLIIEQLKSKNK